MLVKFVRHGETDLNSPIRRMQGSVDYELNENGIKQAGETRDKLNDEVIDIIITSPLKRAKKTAEIINEVKNVELVTDERIKERDYGDLETKEFKDEYFNLAYDYKSVNGEDVNNYLSRLKDFLNDIKNTYQDKKVLVVAHNGVISTISYILDGEGEDKNLINRGLKNGEVKEFDI